VAASGHRSPVIPDLLDNALQTLFADAEVRTFPKNTVLINEGDRTDSVYLIRSGRVKVFLRGEDGKKVDINVLEPGDFFGEMTLDHGLRSASVATMGPAQLSIIPQSVFRKFVIGNPEFAMRVILKLILRARGLLKNVKSLALVDVYGRVVRILLELATVEGSALVIKDKLSAQDIAYRIGASRESVSRILKSLVQRKYIQVDGSRVTIAGTLPQT